MATNVQPKAADVIEQIEADLRKQHKFIRRVDVPLRDLEEDEQLADLPEHEVANLLFRRPQRQAMSAMARFAATNITRACEVVLKDALVHGDKALLDDDEIFYALMPVAKELCQGREIALKKR